MSSFAHKIIPHICYRQDGIAGGIQKNGLQRYYCRRCLKYQQAVYRYRACSGMVDGQVKSLVCESVGIRGISRILGIACGTVLEKIRRIANTIGKPVIREGQVQLEVDPQENPSSRREWHQPDRTQELIDPDTSETS
jgi:transposase-like protein